MELQTVKWSKKITSSPELVGFLAYTWAAIRPRYCPGLRWTGPVSCDGPIKQTSKIFLPWMSAHLTGCGDLGRHSVSLGTSSRQKRWLFLPTATNQPQPPFSLLLRPADQHCCLVWLESAPLPVTACHCHFSHHQSTPCRSTLLTVVIYTATAPWGLTASQLLLPHCHHCCPDCCKWCCWHHFTP